MLVEKVENNKETNVDLSDFEVGDGVYDTVTHKLYLIAHDLEDPLPGQLVDKADNEDNDEDCDYGCDDDDEDDDDDDETAADNSCEHGYFIYDPISSNQETRLYHSSPQAAIKAYFVRRLKHDFMRVPHDQIRLSFSLD